MGVNWFLCAVHFHLLRLHYIQCTQAYGIYSIICNCSNAYNTSYCSVKINKPQTISSRKIELRIEFCFKNILFCSVVELFEKVKQISGPKVYDLAFEHKVIHLPPYHRTEFEIR